MKGLLHVVGVAVLASVCYAGMCFADAPESSEDGGAVGGPITDAEPPDTRPMTLERADGDTLAQAVGHYARTRALLLSAIQEFDRACKIAKPNAILDSEAWREDLINRARDLEKILAPQPRITKGGVKFEGDRRLLKTEADGK